MKVNDVVQINPEKATNPAFGGCFMVITEVKSWGVQGHVQAFGTRDSVGGQAYYRAKFDEVEYVGEAIWMVSEEEEAEDCEQPKKTPLHSGHCAGTFCHKYESCNPIGKTISGEQVTDCPFGEINNE
jgi:hypothetical protein